MGRAYWLDLFTGTTWEEFLAAGGEVSGHRATRWSIVQKMQPGDWLLCYVTGISRWIGILEVTGLAFKDSKPIWKGDAYPARVPVKVIEALKPEHAVPVTSLKDKLSYFDSPSPYGWVQHFRASPLLEQPENATAVVEAIQEAALHPVARSYSMAKWKRVPHILKAVHEGGESEEDESGETLSVPTDEGTETSGQDAHAVSHEEIEWLLLKMGGEMEFDVWLAKNDRGKAFNGQVLGEMPHVLDKLPAHFDSASNKTIELIDVLWLEGSAFVAAFEVEHTTSIYSGLLRMADLVSLQPGINIRLNIVAPDARREKVLGEILRPVFSKMKPPLSERCRFIPYSELKGIHDKFAGMTQYLKPEVLDEIAEPAV